MQPPHLTDLGLVIGQGGFAEASLWLVTDDIASRGSPSHLLDATVCAKTANSDRDERADALLAHEKAVLARVAADTAPLVAAFGTLSELLPSSHAPSNLGETEHDADWPRDEPPLFTPFFSGGDLLTLLKVRASHAFGSTPCPIPSPVAPPAAAAAAPAHCDATRASCDASLVASSPHACAACAAEVAAFTSTPHWAVLSVDVGPPAPPALSAAAAAAAPATARARRLPCSGLPPSSVRWLLAALSLRVLSAHAAAGIAHLDIALPNIAIGYRTLATPATAAAADTAAAGRAEPVFSVSLIDWGCAQPLPPRARVPAPDAVVAPAPAVPEAGAPAPASAAVLPGGGGRPTMRSPDRARSLGRLTFDGASKRGSNNSIPPCCVHSLGSARSSGISFGGVGVGALGGSALGGDRSGGDRSLRASTGDDDAGTTAGSSGGASAGVSDRRPAAATAGAPAPLTTMFAPPAAVDANAAAYCTKPSAAAVTGSRAPDCSTESRAVLEGQDWWALALCGLELLLGRHFFGSAGAWRRADPARLSHVDGDSDCDSEDEEDAMAAHARDTGSDVTPIAAVAPSTLPALTSMNAEAEDVDDAAVANADAVQLALTSDADDRSGRACAGAGADAGSGQWGVTVCTSGIDCAIQDPLAALSGDCSPGTGTHGSGCWAGCECGDLAELASLLSALLSPRRPRLVGAAVLSQPALATYFPAPARAALARAEAEGDRVGAAAALTELATAFAAAAPVPHGLQQYCWRQRRLAEAAVAEAVAEMGIRGCGVVEMPEMELLAQGRSLGDAEAEAGTGAD